MTDDEEYQVRYLLSLQADTRYTSLFFPNESLSAACLFVDAVRW